MRLLGRVGQVLVVLLVSIASTATGEAEPVVVRLDAPGASRLLGSLPEQGAVIQMLLTWEKPGTLVDTVGIAKAEPGNVQLLVQEDGGLQLSVFAPGQKGADEIGWRRLLSTRKIARGSEQRVTLGLGPLATLHIEGAAQGAIPAPPAWPLQRLYLGDFPGDAALDPKGGARRGLVGTVRLTYWGPGDADHQATTLARRAQALTQKAPDEALRLARLVVRLEPKQAAGLAARAGAHEHLGNRDAAISDLKRSLSLVEHEGRRAWLARLQRVSADEPAPGATERTVGPKGGRITLAGTATLEIPPGAVQAPTAISLAERPSPAEGTPRGVRRRLFDAHGPEAGFAKPVTLRFMLGEGDNLDPTAHFVGRQEDPNSYIHMLPHAIETGPQGARLVVQTTHFCTIIWDLSTAVKPKPSVPPIEIGIYKQSRSPYCWAACVQMLLRAGGHRDGSLLDVVGSIGDVADKEGKGISFYDLRWDKGLARHIGGTAGRPPIRRVWDPLKSPFVPGLLEEESLLHYVKRQLSDGIPVMVTPNGKAHAYVLLGYDQQDMFWYHDPRSDGGALGYRRASAKDLGLTQTFIWDFVTTIHLGAPAAPRRPLTTINLENERLFFGRPASNPQDPPGRDYKLRWDHTQARGYTIDAVGKKASGHEHVIQPETNLLHISDRTLKEGIAVCNARRAGPPIDVEVRLRVLTESGQEVRASSQKLRLGPLERKPVYEQIQLADLRDGTPEHRPLAFVLRAEVLEAAAVVDRIEVTFVLAPKESREKLPELITREFEEAYGQLLVRLSYYDDSPQIPKDWVRSTRPGSALLPARIVRHGSEETYAMPGRKLIGRAHYVRGRISGARQTWHENGKPASESYFDRGRVTQTTTWRKDGSLESERRWKPKNETGDLADCEIVEYSRHGIETARGRLVDMKARGHAWEGGLRDGPWRLSQVTGLSGEEPYATPIEEGTYRRGKRIGEWVSRSFVGPDKKRDLTSRAVSVYGSDGRLERVASVDYERDGGRTERSWRYDEKNNRIDEVTKRFDAEGNPR